MPDFVALGKFNKVHWKTFKVKRDYSKKEAQELLVLLTQLWRSVISVYVSVYVCVREC